MERRLKIDSICEMLRRWEDDRLESWWSQAKAKKRRVPDIGPSHEVQRINLSSFAHTLL